jgi:hypothetical protein
VNRAQAAQVIAGTVADAIRERLITYTPVKTPHQALILAYTSRQLTALRELCRVQQLDPGPYLSDIAPAIDAAARDAAAAGLAVPMLPEE